MLSSEDIGICGPSCFVSRWFRCILIWKQWSSFSWCTCCLVTVSFSIWGISKQFACDAVSLHWMSHGILVTKFKWPNEEWLFKQRDKHWKCQMAKVMKQNKWSNEKNFNCPNELFLSEFHCTYSILTFATSALHTHTKLPVIWLSLHVILTLVFLNSYYLQVTLLTGTQECLAMKLITFLSFYILTTGNQGSAWKLASVSILPVKQSWQVTFEAIRGNGVLGDIAIDDFSLSSTGCGGGAYSGRVSLSLSPFSSSLSFSLSLSLSISLASLSSPTLSHSLIVCLVLLL